MNLTITQMILEYLIKFLLATATTIWRTANALHSAKGLLFKDQLAILVTCLWWVGSAIFAFAGNQYHLTNANLTDSQCFKIELSAYQHEHDMAVGTILFFVVWEVTIIFVWTLKLSVLYNFTSLMAQFDSMRPHLQLARLVWTASFAGVELYQHFKCVPFKKNWQIYPDPGNACQPASATASQYLLNLSDAAMDIMFIAIALDLVRRAGPWISLKHRLILSAIFSAGLLVVGLEVGVLYALHTGVPGAASPWRVRRTTAQLIITNLPSLYPSLLKASRILRHRLRAIMTKRKPQQASTEPIQPPQADLDIETGISLENVGTAESGTNADRPNPSRASSTTNLIPHDQYAEHTVQGV